MSTENCQSHSRLEIDPISSSNGLKLKPGKLSLSEMKGASRMKKGQVRRPERPACSKHRCMTHSPIEVEATYVTWWRHGGGFRGLRGFGHGVNTGRLFPTLLRLLTPALKFCKIARTMFQNKEPLFRIRFFLSSWLGMLVFFFLHETRVLETMGRLPRNISSAKK